MFAEQMRRVPTIKNFETPPAPRLFFDCCLRARGAALLQGGGRHAAAMHGRAVHRRDPSPVRKAAKMASKIPGPTSER